jgi:hypothetical protein
MARFVGYLVPIPSEHGRALRPRRALALGAIIALSTATIAPGWAAAAEPDSEGEGTAPPGLENPHFEPGGEEAPLEVLPGGAESGSGAEEIEGPPIETEPAQESELSEPAAEAVPPVAAEGAPPAPAAPEYAPAAPEYIAPAPSSAPVENDPIVAPSAAGPPPRSEPAPAQPEPQAAVPEAVAEAPPAVVPSGEGEAPPHEAPPPAQAPAAVAGSGGVSPPLRGRSSYTVRPGNCLWSIAEALLPSGAPNAEIAAKVAWLWGRNADRIGSGDPNVILVGTVLELA